MGAKEWREASEKFNQMFPRVAADCNFNVIDADEKKLIDFLISDEGEAAQELLKVSHRSIPLGERNVQRQTFDMNIVRLYRLDEYGLSWSGERFGDGFEAFPSDVVKAFHSHNPEKIGIVEYIKKQFDIIAAQTLKEASK